MKRPSKTFDAVKMKNLAQAQLREVAKVRDVFGQLEKELPKEWLTLIQNKASKVS